MQNFPTHSKFIFIDSVGIRVIFSFVSTWITQLYDHLLLERLSFPLLSAILFLSYVKCLCIQNLFLSSLFYSIGSTFFLCTKYYMVLLL